MYQRREINLRRVLSACERFLHEDDLTNWRFKQYLKHVESEFSDIRNENQLDDDDRLAIYQRRITILKQKSIEQENAASKSGGDRHNKLEQIEQRSHMLDDLSARGNQSLNSSNILDQRPRKPQRKFTSTRAELLDIDESRHANESTDSVQIRQRKKQQDLQNQLISTTRQLKHQSLLARDQMNRDMQTIDSTGAQVTQNTSRIEKENERLDVLNRNTSVCGTLTLLFIVWCIFIAMVVFIRLFPNIHKKRS